jgi:hypothetical protein
LASRPIDYIVVIADTSPSAIEGQNRSGLRVETLGRPESGDRYGFAVTSWYHLIFAHFPFTYNSDLEGHVVPECMLFHSIVQRSVASNIPPQKNETIVSGCDVGKEGKQISERNVMFCKDSEQVYCWSGAVQLL